MQNKKSCREAFTAALLELARNNRDILAVTSDARGSCSLGEYAQALPEQFVEVGIAEQNEIGVAAGLAAVGKRPYVCAPACFLSARSLEQIKVDVAYSGQNVKIFGVSGGVSYGALGASHHSVHDVAALRAIPGINVLLPCDANQTVRMLRALEETDAPAYIRVGRGAVPQVYGEDAPFRLGKANRLRDGKDLTIIAAGETLWHALQAAELLAEEGVGVRLLDMHTLKPLDEEAILEAARDTGRILTVEEHSVNGGLGAAVAQVTAAGHPVPVHCLGLPDGHLEPGDSAALFAHYGLDTQGICRAAKELMGR